MYIELYHIKNDKSIDKSLNYLKYDKKVTIWSGEAHYMHNNL